MRRYAAAFVVLCLVAMAAGWWLAQPPSQPPFDPPLGTNEPAPYLATICDADPRIHFPALAHFPVRTISDDNRRMAVAVCEDKLRHERGLLARWATAALLRELTAPAKKSRTQT
jgi:hypothetical protein